MKPGKGGAFVRTKLRSIDDGSVIDKTFRAGEKFRPVRTEIAQDAVPLRLRRRGGLHGQPRLRADRDPDASSLGDAMRWVLPNDEVEVLFVDEQPSDVQVPSAVEMKVDRDRARGQGRHRLRRRQQAGDARVRGRRPGAALHRRGRNGPRRHPQRRVRLARVARRADAATPKRENSRCAGPTNAATPSSPATSATSPGVRSRSCSPTRSPSPASWPRASRPPRRARRGDRRATPRAGTLDRIAPLERNVMRVALYRDRAQRRRPDRGRDRRGGRDRQGVLRRRRARVRQRHPRRDRRASGEARPR